MVYREVKIPESPKPEKEEPPPPPPSKFWGTALTVGALAGSALMAWGIYHLSSSEAGPSDPFSEPEEKKKKKMMKAPGRDYQIPRDDFNNDSAYRRGHFRRLREDKKNLKGKI